MRLIILLFTCFLSLTAFSQHQHAENKAQSRKVTHSHRGINSVWEFGVSVTDTAAMDADTLTFPRGLQVTYRIGIIAHHNDSLYSGAGNGTVILKNTRGIYTIVGQEGADGTGFTGTGSLAKARWWIAIENNLPILNVTGVPGGRVNWIITENASL